MQPVDDDGVVFDVDGLETAPIREEVEYGSVRIRTTAAIAGACVLVQVDIGFGDPSHRDRSTQSINSWSTRWRRACGLTRFQLWYIDCIDIGEQQDVGLQLLSEKRTRKILVDEASTPARLLSGRSTTAMPPPPAQ
jgi:hypothetical protein